MLAGGRFEGVWLEDVTLEDGVVSGRFEQSVLDLDLDQPGLPAAEETGSTSWYQQFKVPVVACRFVVREATALDVDDLDDPVFRVEWRPSEGQLVFDCAVTVTSTYPNLEVIATDEVVGFARLKRWKILGMESGGEWTDD